MSKQVFTYTDEHGRPICIDSTTDRNGVITGTYSGETLEQIAARYPDAQLTELDTFIELQDAYYRSGVREITEAEWWEALGVLPPAGWTRDECGESFKCSERTCGNITNIYARRGDRYYALSDSIFTPHTEIMERIPA